MSDKFVNFGVPICLFCFFLVVFMWKNDDVHFFPNKNQSWIIQNASEVINLTLLVKGKSITWRFAVSLCQHADFHFCLMWVRIVYRTLPIYNAVLLLLSVLFSMAVLFLTPFYFHLYSNQFLFRLCLDYTEKLWAETETSRSQTHSG